MVTRHPFLDHDRPIAFAHRGGTSHAPENTLAAFQHAIDLGFRYLETDVQVSSDGVLVAFHDDDLRRTCGVDRKISQTTWAEISQYRVGGLEPIPLLRDILATWPDAKINIDCKSDEALAPLVSCLRSTNSLDRVCVGSFSDRRLNEIRQELGPAVCTSMGPRAVARMLAGSLRTPVGVPLGHAVQIPVRQGPIPVATRSMVRHAHENGIAVHVWTIDDPTEIARLLDLGVDGIMSDDIQTLRDIYVARRIW